MFYWFELCTYKFTVVDCVFISMYSETLFYKRLSLGPVYLVHWTRLDGDMCLKVDTCHYFKRSSTVGH